MFILHLTKIKAKFVTLGVVFISLTLLQNGVTGVSQQKLPIPLEQVKTDEKVVAITINVDWGEAYIPTMLTILDQYQAKATFFVTGRWASKNPQLIEAMVSQGHTIGNHGYYHLHPDQLSVVKNKEELIKAEKVLLEITAKKPTFYAPPYGERGKNGLLAAEELGYTTVLWTLDTIDWRADSTPELIVSRILNPKMRYGKVPEKKGAIILMHPKENTVTALPQILGGLQREGFQMVGLEKLITFESMGNTTP